MNEEEFEVMNLFLQQQPLKYPPNMETQTQEVGKNGILFIFSFLFRCNEKRRAVRFSSLSLFDDHQHCVNFLVKHGTFIMYPAHKWSFKKICNLVFKLQNKQNTKKFECERLGWNVCAAARDERRSRCPPPAQHHNSFRSRGGSSNSLHLSAFCVLSSNSTSKGSSKSQTIGI